LIGVILRQNGSPPALRTREGLVGPGSEGQLSDALFAVVVEAGEDLGLAEVILTNGAGDLLLQLFHSLLYRVWSFSHRDCRLFLKRRTKERIKLYPTVDSCIRYAYRYLRLYF